MDHVVEAPRGAGNGKKLLEQMLLLGDSFNVEQLRSFVAHDQCTLTRDAGKQVASESFEIEGKREVVQKADDQGRF